MSDFEATTRDASDHAHPRLAAGLMRLQSRGAPAPPAADDAMRVSIRNHFASSSFRSRIAKRWAWASGLGITGVAATIAVIVWLNVSHRNQSPQHAQTTRPNASPSSVHANVAGLSHDFDANGDVNILDAFALARQIESASGKTTLDQTLDLTADGRIDQRDVDAIALRAVALPPRAARDQPGASEGRSS